MLKLSRSNAGILWMCLAMLLSAMAGASVRQLDGAVPTLELVLVRNIVGLLMFLPWLMRQGVGVIRTSRLPLYCLRVFFAYTAMVMLFVVPLFEFMNPLSCRLYAFEWFGRIGRGVFHGSEQTLREGVVITH